MFNVLKQIPNYRFYSSTSVKDIIKARRVGCKFLMKGWARAMRKMKDKVFVDLDDGSTYQRLQIVIPKDRIPDTLSYGSSFEAHGTLVNNTNNQLELSADFISVHGECPLQEGYPFAPRKTYQSDYVRQYLHMRPRTASFSSLLRLRNQLAIATRCTFSEDDFVEVNVPVLSSNDCEGAGELFIVKPENENLVKSMASHDHQCPFEVFFNNQTYLTVSGQLHLECLARSLTKVFTIGPTFRAENSKSRLHLSEFYMIEAEQAFINNIEELLSVIEKTTSTVVKKLLDDNDEEINIIRKMNSTLNEYDINNMINTPYEVISYGKACDILEKQKHFTKPVIRGKPLTKEHELFLVQYNNLKPIFIIDWPQKLKPFYAKTLPNNDSLVSAVDLLCPNVGELCGGSVRENDYSVLEKKLSDIGLQEKLDWYLDLRKFGNVSTAGFGIGFERFLQVLLNIQNIKDTIAFPRYPHNCKT